jgi:hypothetical protein
LLHVIETSPLAIVTVPLSVTVTLAAEEDQTPDNMNAAIRPPVKVFAR